MSQKSEAIFRMKKQFALMLTLTKAKPMNLRILRINRASVLSTIAISAITVLLSVPVMLSANPASAQTAGMQGNYIGAGVSAGVTNGGKTGDAATLGGNIQGRYAIPNVPVSVRGAVLFGGESAAIMPIVSYDLPVAKNTNVYLGAGYSFVTNNGKPSPLGNRDAVMLTTGVETGVSRNVVVYGDVKWGIDAYKNSSADALSLQLGAGIRF